MTSNPTQPVENLSRAVQSLSKVGATKILVANLPDLGKIPATRNTAYSSVLSAAAIAHNLTLAQELDHLKPKLGQNTQIIELDVQSVYQQAIAHPKKFGFTDVTTACLHQLATCKNPNEFLFWDGIHPTTAAHLVLGEVALSRLNNSGER